MKKLKKTFKSKKIDPYAPLDDYERDLIKAINNDEFVTVPNVKKEIKRYQSYAAYTLRMLRKNKRVTIRIPKQDLDHIQNKAIETGIPYQTLITSILHQFATKKIRLSI